MVDKPTARRQKENNQPQRLAVRSLTLRKVRMSTAFLRKFENRISVTNRDGSITKVGEPAASVGPACNSPGKSHLHPALLATGLTGHSGGNAWPVLTETTMQPAVQVMQLAQAAQLPSPQRKVRGKPTAAELEVRSLTHPARRRGCRRRAAPHGPVCARRVSCRPPLPVLGRHSSCRRVDTSNTLRRRRHAYQLLLLLLLLLLRQCGRLRHRSPYTPRRVT